MVGVGIDHFFLPGNPTHQLLVAFFLEPGKLPHWKQTVSGVGAERQVQGRKSEVAA